MTYNESILDIVELRRHAKRVARDLGGVPPKTEWVDVEVRVAKRRWLFKSTLSETQINRTQVTTPGTRWHLGTAHSLTTEKLGGRNFREDHYDVAYWLEHDGSLTAEVHEYYDLVYENRYSTGSDTTSSHEMTEVDMLYFDRKGISPTGPIWAPKKGVGLSARLTRLRREVGAAAQRR